MRCEPARLFVLIATVVSAFVLAGCGGDGSGGTSASHDTGEAGGSCPARVKFEGRIYQQGPSDAPHEFADGQEPLGEAKAVGCDDGEGDGEGEDTTAPGFMVYEAPGESPDKAIIVQQPYGYMTVSDN